MKTFCCVLIAGFLAVSSRAQSTNLVLFGDSITGGDGASSFASSWPGIVATQFGYGVWDLAISGTEIPDEMGNIYSAPGGGAYVYALLTGYNDMRERGTNGLLDYQACLLSALAWTSLPTGSQAWPTNAPGWMNTIVYGLTNHYIASAETGAVASLTVTGPTVFLEMVQCGQGGGTCTVSVDGTSQTNLFLGGNDPDGWGNPDSSMLLYWTGLTNAQHVISVECSGDGVVTVGWSAGWTPGSGGNLFFVGNCLPMMDDAYVQANAPEDSLGSDAAVAVINGLILEACEQMAAIGLPVWFVDVASQYDPYWMAGPDGIHPNDAGHTAIAAAFSPFIQGNGRPIIVPELDRVSVFSQAGLSLTLQTSADLMSWSAATNCLSSGVLTFLAPTNGFVRASQVAVSNP